MLCLCFTPLFGMYRTLLLFGISSLYFPLAKKIWFMNYDYNFLSSPLFCRWWNYPSPYIIWNMSRWSRTCEELGIITSRPYITFSSLLCYDALMLQIHDQELIRNLASLAAAPTLPSPLFSVMMLWCSKFMIKWWLTCFWGLYYYYLFFWYIVVL